MEDFQKNKIRINLTIAGIVIVIAIIIVIINIAINNNKHKKFLLVGENLILEKNGNQWTQQKSFTDDIEKNKFIVNNGVNTYKNVSLDRSAGQYYYLDNQFNEIGNVRIAYSNIDNIPLANYDKTRCDDSDVKYFEEVLKGKNIADINRFIIGGTKIDYDIDTDGQVETIYTSTNRSFEKIKDQIVSVMLVVKNGTIVDSYTQIAEDSYRIIEILDLNNDGKYEFIINRKDIDVATYESCYQIYEIDKSKWKLKQDCQE